MSSIKEQEQVDYTPDSEIHDDDIKEPARSCKNCVHAQVCFFYTKLNDCDMCFKEAQFLTLPYKPEILAMTCKLFKPKDEKGIQKDFVTEKK